MQSKVYPIFFLYILYELQQRQHFYTTQKKEGVRKNMKMKIHSKYVTERI